MCVHCMSVRTHSAALEVGMAGEDGNSWSGGDQIVQRFREELAIVVGHEAHVTVGPVQHALQDNIGKKIEIISKSPLI